MRTFQTQWINPNQTQAFGAFGQPLPAVRPWWTKWWLWALALPSFGCCWLGFLGTLMPDELQGVWRDRSGTLLSFDRGNQGHYSGPEGDFDFYWYRGANTISVHRMVYDPLTQKDTPASYADSYRYTVAPDGTLRVEFPSGMIGEFSRN